MTTTTTTGISPSEEAPEEEASPTKPPLSMEQYVEEYLVVPIRKRACSTIIVVPCLAISTALVLTTGRYDLIWDRILVPAVHLLLRILGIALGIGLGLGLATHVHDTLETWHERQFRHDHLHDSFRNTTRERSLSTSSLYNKNTTKSSTHYHNFDQDETSYAALMTSAGYDVVSNGGIRRGQILKSALKVNYPFTQAMPPEEQHGPNIMKRQWPHLPPQITHEIGRWIEHIMRDYVAVWYCMIDASCPYQNERIRRQEQQQQQQEEEEAQNVNGNGTTTSRDGSTSTTSTTTGGVVVHRRQMVLQTGPYRPLPLVTAMYHSLAIVFGNLASRMEHMNVYSLVLLKFTRVLSLQLKTWRELRTMALAAKMSNNNDASSTNTTTTMLDEFGNAAIQQKRRQTVSEMTMAKEFLLADKLHKAVTFGMDVPSLLFADSCGKECNDDNDDKKNMLTEEEVLERRLLVIMEECECDYNRVVGHRLCRALLPRSEFASPIVRALVTELVGGCVLKPIMSVFAPDYVNGWMLAGLQAVLASKQKKQQQQQDDDQQVATEHERTWDYEQDSVADDRVEVELEMDTVFQDETQLMEGEEDADLHQSGLNEAIEVIRNPTTEDGADMDDNDSQVLPLSSDDDEHHHHHQGHDSQTVSGDYILPLLTMAIIDLQRFVDFGSFDPQEDGTDWDEEECQDAVRQIVLVIEAALIHGRRRQRLTKRELDKKAGSSDDTRRDHHEGDTLLPFFSSNLSQVLMELTSDIDAFETRIAKEETRLKSDQNEEPKKKGDGPSMSCKPPMSELSTLRTLIAAWLHTGQVYKTLSLLIQARQSILVPYFHEDAFLRDSENGKGFVSQLRALDGLEIMVDTSSILASSTLDANVDKAKSPSPKKRNLTIQPTSPSANSLNTQQSPRLAASLTQSMARRGERLSRFMSGASHEDATEYGVSVGASMNSVTGSEQGPTPRYLDFHRNQNFSSSLRSERERRKESWQHVCAAMPDQTLKIVHRVKGSTPENKEFHRDLHRLSRTFYAGTNKIGLKDGTRRKPIEADTANSNEGEGNVHDDNDEVLPVSLLTVEMTGAKRRIEIPDDDSSFLIRAQPRPLKSVNVHVDERDHGQSYRTFAATFEEAAVPSGSFRYSGGRYIRRCLLRYYPNDRTASIELPSLESARKLDCRKASDGGPPTSITLGPVPPKANPLSGDFLREHHLCQKWVPRGAAPRAGSSLLASPTMELSDFHSVPRAGKSLDFVYRMSLFECPMIELSGKKFTVHDSDVLGAHRADASSIELSDASLSVALLTAGQDWERELSEQDDHGRSRENGAPEGQTGPGIEMGPDGYPIVWIKLHKKQGDAITTDIQPYRASFMRAAMMLASTRQDAQRQCLEYCVRAGSARNATRARVDSLLKPAQRLLEFATSQSREKQSILMRDLKLGINHVDREQLRRNKLLSPRFPTNILTLSATVEECMTVKETGVTFPGSSPSSTVFKIRCVAIVDLIDTEDDAIDWSDYISGDESRSSTFREEWIVYRQFRDFNALHKHLKSQVAVSETSGTASSRLVGAATAAFTVGGGPSSSERHRKALIPSLGQANKAGALGLTQKAIEKRRTILHDYLQHLLAPNHPLRQCSEILIFLGAFYPFPGGIRVGEAPTVEPDSLGRVGMVRTVYGESAVTLNVQDESAVTEQSSFSSPDKSVTIKARSYSAADSVNTFTENQPPTRRRSSRFQEEDIPPAIKAKIDKVPLSKVRQTMFELIRAQFDFENASFFRNRLLTAIKTMSFAVASNAEFRKTLYNTHKSYLNPEALADLIKLGLETIWPDGVFFESSPPLTPEQSQELAEKTREFLISAFPDQLRSILGAEITVDGLEMLHEMLQNRVVLKSLFYMFVDLLLLEVFPEFQDILTGCAALETE